jgi:hypothetical protein
VYYLNTSGALKDLLDALANKQGREPDISFAKKLGISRQTWAAYKNETRRPSGIEFYTTVNSVYPELQLLTFRVINEGDSEKVADK